jgi:hypothetical protein
MRDYTKIEAWKLADDLTVLLYQITKAFFACLIGLISVVEKETGKLGKTIAAITSAIVLGLAGILRP